MPRHEGGQAGDHLVDRRAGGHADPHGAAQRALVAQRLASLFDFGESGLDPGEVVGARVG
jgi:hypothetical protein